MSSASLSTSSQKKSNRRHKYAINPNFQWKYTLSISLGVFLISSILSAVLFVVLHEQARHRLMYPTSYVVDTGMVILMSALAFSILTAAGTGFWSFLVTHRICGPLYVLGQHFDRLATGKMPNLRPLRRKDEFKDLFQSFCSAVETVKREKQSQFDSVGKALNALEGAGGDNDQERRDALESASAQLNEMRNVLADALDVDVDSGLSGNTPSSQPVPSCEPASVV